MILRSWFDPSNQAPFFKKNDRSRIGLPGFSLALVSAIGLTPLGAGSQTPVSWSHELADARHARQAGKYDEAQSHARAALAAASAQGDPRGTISSNATIALLAARDDNAQGLLLLEEAIETARRVALPDLVAELSLDRGSLLAARGDYFQAATQFDSVAAASKEASNSQLAAQAFTNAARAWLDAGNRTQAVTRLREGASFAKELSHDSTSAAIRVNLGRISERLIESEKSISERADLLLLAHASYADALEAALDTHDDPVASFTLERLAALYAKDGQTADAIQLAQRAILRAESSERPELAWRSRALLGTLLSANGNIEGAINTLTTAVDGAESVGARGALDEVRGPAYLELVDLLLSRAALRDDPSQQQSDLRAAQGIMERFKAAELRDYFQDECVDAYEARNRDPSQVSPRALVIYPILLNERLVLLISGPGFIRQEVAPIPAKRVIAEARAFRRKVVNRVTNEYRPHAQQLYRWLVEPASGAIAESSAETLIFVPTGPLLSIPYAALMIDEEFLVERYAVAVIPGLELTDPRPIGGRDLDILAAGLSEAVQGYAELPNVAQEIEMIDSLYEGDMLLNESFSAAGLESSIAARQFDMVHLASHAQFGASSEDTYLLTYDGQISIDELAALVGRLRYRDRPLEMLTLSACETAAGDERAALGLIGMAVKAGARSALGSLWSVNDAAAKKIMSGVYRALREPGVSRAESLRRAQRALIKDDQLRHPGYWSAFILVSNWL